METERGLLGGASAQLPHLPVPCLPEPSFSILPLTPPFIPGFLFWSFGLWGVEMGLGGGSHFFLFLGLAGGRVLGHPSFPAPLS